MIITNEDLAYQLLRRLQLRGLVSFASEEELEDAALELEHQLDSYHRELIVNLEKMDEKFHEQRDYPPELYSWGIQDAVNLLRKEDDEY